MQLRGLELKTRLWKAVGFVMMLTILLSLRWFAQPGMVSADPFHTSDPATSLTIRVGYYGGPYHTKKVYTLSDLEAMPQVEQAYTFIDSMPAVVLDSARGVKLTDILADSGIDVNSVEAFYFYATDVKKGWYECLPKSFLLDTDRYYYPNLPTHWDFETQSAIPGAVYGAVQVEPIIALHDNWKRFATYPDFTVHDTSTRFRLLFGQNDTSTRTASRSAKWVHAIEVMLGGMPPTGIVLNQEIANVKVGSTVQLTAAILPPEESTDRRITWKSSDTSVATVNRDGLVKVVGPGTAVITVSTVVGNLTASCVVNGPEGGVDQLAASSAGGPPNNVERGDQTGTQLPETDQQYLEDKEAADTVSKTSRVSLERSGSQPWRVFEMSADAVPLQQMKEKNSMDIYAAILFAILFLFGSGRGYMEYVREETR
ncbi:Ig-like domain-containing protein [Pelotomaculum terephthalicicum JT]|uniref:Ig-like domain-containing protein n=1 Tax=Pelotomaculum terephthalicicum TaxID=206393 RepID=UPI001F036E73|nr:Ig-like domain-containing protein [Pelotomaculum terephthalicicum]MCG9967284.1 Ig-like domain-containing protein [Pelotomaculum terephthalicicum JT]